MILLIGSVLLFINLFFGSMNLFFALQGSAVNASVVPITALGLVSSIYIIWVGVQDV